MSGDLRFGQRWSTAQRLKNDGVYALLSHSGITLAPLLAELVARDLSGDADPRLDPYRPNCRIGSTP